MKPLGKVAENLSFEECALMADTITAGFGVINNNAKAKIGQSVVIIGCGGIGLGVVLGASLAGAHPIVGVDLHEQKLENTKACGAGQPKWLTQVKLILLKQCLTLLAFLEQKLLPMVPEILIF